MLGMGTLARKVFGTANDRKLRAYRPIVQKINALEEETRALSDDALRARTESFRQRLKAGESLDDLLPEAFATVREASRRALGLRHFDVQLIGGIVLHQGKIAEMKTGEGKTLVATLPAYLNALSGKGVHVVTVNDYLARRDAEWMGRIYRFLGPDGGRRSSPASPRRRSARAYRRRHHLRHQQRARLRLPARQHEDRLEDMVQRGTSLRHRRRGRLDPDRRGAHAADHLGADRGPLGASTSRSTRSSPSFEPEHYEIDEKHAPSTLTEPASSGRAALRRGAAEGQARSTTPRTSASSTTSTRRCARTSCSSADATTSSATARWCIIDEFTGRMMAGRRCRTGCTRRSRPRRGSPIQPENQTLASITFQNYFRLYDKLAGMTGTATTEAEEFAEIYKLDVVEVPDQPPGRRRDEDDAGLPDRGREVRRDRRDRGVPRIARPAGAWSAPPRSRSPSSVEAAAQEGASRTTC
ncbi:MAG: hypothetical protein KatS3mg118_3720 [Paracoccaceae bacterium]|nr:MAG: hypothetical protein KatS3mg118_3720 [Paracoccaceae bacterium]